MSDCLSAADGNRPAKRLLKGHRGKGRSGWLFAAQLVNLMSVHAELIRVCPQCHHLLFELFVKRIR